MKAQPLTKYEAYLLTEDFDRLRQRVLERDNHRCVVCRSSENLQIHHLTYQNIYHEQLRDLVTLCSKCHRTYHEIDGRRKALEEQYDIEEAAAAEYRQQQIQQPVNDYKTEWQRQKEEERAIIDEIKAEYLEKDYCKNGDLDMVSWETINKIIDAKCQEHGLKYFGIGSGKKEIQSYFIYRRCEFLLRCMDKNLSLQAMINGTKFDYQWLVKWYRRKKCEAKLNEEKELYKEEKES